MMVGECPTTQQGCRVTAHTAAIALAAAPADIFRPCIASSSNLVSTTADEPVKTSRRKALLRISRNIRGFTHISQILSKSMISRVLKAMS